MRPTIAPAIAVALLLGSESCGGSGRAPVAELEAGVSTDLEREDARSRESGGEAAHAADAPELDGGQARDPGSRDDGTGVDAGEADCGADDCGPDAGAALPAVSLNEVGCHGRDWIEIANLSAAEAADISGHVVADDPADDKDWYAAPEGTVIPAGGFVVLWRQTEDEDGFTFGLKCGQDAVHLLRPDGTVMDSADLPLTQEGNTRGRLPDGAGEWAETMATPGAANAAAPDLSVILFTLFHVAEIDITLPDSSVDALWQDPKTFVPGKFSLESELASSGEMEVGVRLKGGWGSFRQLDAKSAFRVQFSYSVPEQRFLGLQNLTLNNMVQDGSMIHEVLGYAIFEAMGIPCPRAGYAWVRVNGEPYGLYLMIERYDDVFLSRYYVSTQHLYEGEYGIDVLPGSVGAFDVDEGDEKKRQDLQKLVSLANDTPDDEWMAALAIVSDLEEMTRMWAVEQYIGHWDGYAPTINNYFLHADDNGYFTMLAWGIDQTFSDFRNYYDGNGYLFKRCLAVPECLALYNDALVSVLAAVDSLALDPLAETLSDHLAPWADEDPRKPYPSEAIPDNVQWTREFMASRRDDLAALVQCLQSPDPDPDGDGFVCLSDCDEGDPLTHHGAAEICGDWIDQDCNGALDDGYECPDCKELFHGVHRYLVCPVPRPWDEARFHCQESGAELVIVDDPLEETWMRSTLAALGIGDAWMGLSDIEEEGHFVWWDGTEPPYTNWNPGEPNDWGGEDCGQFQTFAAWNDLPCDAQLPVVCEDVCAAGEDGDGDGFLLCAADCDDSEALINPLAAEICADGVDQDCSGQPDDTVTCQAPQPLAVEPPSPGATFWYSPLVVAREEAREICLALPPDGDLVRFDSPEELSSVRAAIDAMAPGSEPWIGLNDLAEEGVYMWTDGTPPAFFNWSAGQPNNGDGNQDCARMLGDGTWNDTDCGKTFPFVCRTGK